MLCHCESYKSVVGECPTVGDDQIVVNHVMGLVELMPETRNTHTQNVHTTTIMYILLLPSTTLCALFCMAYRFLFPESLCVLYVLCTFRKAM